MISTLMRMSHRLPLIFRCQFVFLWVTASLGLSACLGGPPPKLYLLESPTIDTTEQAAEASTLDALGIRQVKVPGYAIDERIASVSTDGIVVKSDGQRWAEEPEVAITRILANRLRQRASATVLVEPWPRDYAPQARIEIVFERLLREPDGGASLSGQMHLLSGDGRKLLQSIEFSRLVPGFSLDSKAYFRSIAVAVDDIARIAVESLLTLRSPS